MDYRMLYCFPFFLSAALIFVVALFTLGRVNVRGGWYLTGVCLASTVWATSEGMLYFGFDIATNMFITKFQYLGITTVPPLVLLFVLSVFGFDSWVNRKTHLFFFLMAVFVILLVWTNPLHHLFFTESYPISSGPFPMLGLKHGPLWKVVLLYHYALVAVLTVILLHQMVAASGYHRYQAVVILVAVAFVCLCNAVYLTGNSPVTNMDISPIGFVGVAAAMAWGFFRYGLLDILPIARAAIFRGLDDLILVVDAKDRILNINPAAESIFKVKTSQITGRDALELSRLCPQLKEVFERPESSEVTLMQDGREHVYDLRISFLTNADGLKIGKVIALRDITERKKAENEKEKLHRQLLRAEKMEAIGTLAGGVAHDLNNILSSLINYPELLLMDMPEDSPLRKPLLTIKKSGERACAVVQDLLTLARRGVSVSEVVNLNDIVGEYMNSPQFDKLISEHPGVTVETDLDSVLFNIQGSPVHLSKTVMNLVSNAAEAMPSGGTIQIKTRNKYIDLPVHGYDEVQEGDYALLTVSDTGVGIAPNEINKIFEPFYTKKVMGRSGTGLGMAVVWGTVKDHTGYIHVASDRAKGTSIKVYLPATRKQIRSKDAPISIENYRGAGQTILVIDDVEEQREIAAGILNFLGYSVETAASGEEACNCLRSKPADLIVLDMIMDPGIDGLETYRRIVSQYPQQKAIIASGFSETKRVREAQRLGAGRYVKKPYTIEKMGMAIKAELEGVSNPQIGLQDKQPTSVC